MFCREIKFVIFEGQYEQNPSSEHLLRSMAGFRAEPSAAYNYFCRTETKPSKSRRLTSNIMTKIEFKFDARTNIPTTIVHDYQSQNE
jgi:hypothetical protein